MLKWSLVHSRCLTPRMITVSDIPEIKLLVISRMVCAQIQALETVEGGILHRLFNEECPQVPPLRDASTYNATQHGYRFIRELR